MSKSIEQAAREVVDAFGSRGTIIVTGRIAKAVTKLETALSAGSEIRCPGDSGHTLIEKDLAMLVRRLCRRLSHSLNESDKTMVEQAQDYLRRKGLQGSVLRSQPTESDGGEKVTLPPLDSDLVAILGRPCFACGRLAERLREQGRDIPNKAEHEQAAVIYFLLGLYLEFGVPQWAEEAKSRLLGASPPKE